MRKARKIEMGELVGLVVAQTGFRAKSQLKLRNIWAAAA
jgi:hypothetical protein